MAVVTMEKANAAVNRLAREDRLAELAVVVVDEAHMVADPGRCARVVRVRVHVCACVRAGGPGQVGEAWGGVRARQGGRGLGSEGGQQAAEQVGCGTP